MHFIFQDVLPPFCTASSLLITVLKQILHGNCPSPCAIECCKIQLQSNKFQFWVTEGRGSDYEAWERQIFKIYMISNIALKSTEGRSIYQNYISIMQRLCYSTQEPLFNSVFSSACNCIYVLIHQSVVVNITRKQNFIFSSHTCHPLFRTSMSKNQTLIRFFKMILQ